MRQDQLWHAIRAACQIAQVNDVIIVGSQSILGSYREDDLPESATMSREVDVWVRSDIAEEDRAHAEMLAAAAGEWSMFDQTHGFHIDGVDGTTTILPRGWEDRLVAVENDQTAGTLHGERHTGWCLEPHDLCAAKLCAHRDKDRAFVLGLINLGLVSTAIILERLDSVDAAHAERAQVARRWVQAIRRG
ncbi:MAG: hypothetical protein LBD77_02050 [Bifidobacteriaceae bacterium]|jgi:hypothetical protein|nr:hypothetical protein [Bifidobacteriaceae bacterium]